LAKLFAVLDGVDNSEILDTILVE